MCKKHMKIISIHTPKAGGTSMLELWKRAFGQNKVLMDYGDPPVNPCAKYLLDSVRWDRDRPTVFPKDINVIHGHFRPHKYDLLNDDVLRLTMLRHPVDNIISIYSYWKKIPPQANVVHRYFLGQKLDVIELAKLPVIQNLYSETYFGDWDMERMDFIGRHEARSDDLRRLGGMLGISIDTNLHLNATEPGGKDPLRKNIESDPRVIRQLESVLAKDIRFYEKYTR